MIRPQTSASAAWLWQTFLLFKPFQLAKTHQTNKQLNQNAFLLLSMNQSNILLLLLLHVLLRFIKNKAQTEKHLFNEGMKANRAL